MVEHTTAVIYPYLTTYLISLHILFDLTPHALPWSGAHFGEGRVRDLIRTWPAQRASNGSQMHHHVNLDSTCAGRITIS